MRALVFVSKNCPYCRHFEKVVRKLEEEFEIDFERVDVDLNPELSEKYGIMILPTLVLVNGDEVIGGFMGFADYKTAYTTIREQMYGVSALFQTHDKN